MMMTTLARTCFLTAGFATGAMTTALAAPVYNETVVHSTTTTVDVNLDASTVLCSSADYGALFLKILIPELSKLTLLDHQNTGAGAPCVAAGACGPGHMPDDIIDPAHPKETVSINVKAIRGDESDAAAQTCTTMLIETVKVTIRGVDFFHERSAPLGTRPYSDCATTTVAPTDPDPDPVVEPDAKTDEPAPPEEPSGCSATGTPTSGLAVLALGLVGLHRRRRRV